MNPTVGQALGGRYHIVRHLGGGGFGTTFLAEDKHLPDNRVCVVKQLKPQASDPSTLQTARRLFDTEAQVLYRLGTHAQIPQLFAYFEENQEFYLVQEFIEGHNLSEEINPGEFLSEDRVITLCCEILEILEFVHQQNVIHRDVNPRNLIRRDRDGKLVLIDFGAVKQISTTVVTGSSVSFTVAIGTPGYRPSEQANGNPKLSSDIYAVGVIGIQALTGLVPSELSLDDDTGEIVWRDKAAVSHEFANILDKMVRYDFRQRYRSASEALLALKNLRTQTAATAAVGVGKLPATPINQSITRQFKIKISQISILIGLLGLGSAAAFYSFYFINSQNATELYRQGKTLSELKRYEESRKAYQRAIELQPNYVEARVGLGKTLFDLKQNEAALAAYHNALELQPNSVEAWTGIGYVMDNLRRYEEALNSFDKAIQIQPTYSEAWQGRSEALINLRRYEEALASYDKALQIQPNLYEAWYGRGWALHNLQRYEEAIASYDKAIDVKPNFSKAWYSKANSLLNLQQYDDAVDAFDKAVTFQPDYYLAWYTRGNVLVKLQRYEEAVDSFDKAIKINPESDKAWYNRGWSLHQLQRYEEAIDSYGKALQLKRNDFQAWYNQGNALYILQRYEKAIASYNKAVRYKPDYYEAWYSRGNALVKEQRYKDAVVSYDKAVQYKSDYREAIEARNWAQSQMQLDKLKLEQNDEKLNQINN